MIENNYRQNILKITDMIVSKVDDNKYITFIIMSLFMILSYGLEIWQYTIYNFDPLYLKENSKNFLLDPMIMMNNNGAYILNIFNNIFKPFLEIPILYIFSSIIIKSTIIYVIYIVVNKITNDKKLSLVVTLFFITSIGYATHGVVLNGVFGAPIFYRASVSGLMTLLGLYLILSNRYFLAIVPIVLSIHLHVLYGVTGFAFIFSSFLLYLSLHSKQNLKRFLLASIVIGFSVLPILLSVDNSSFSVIESNIEQWYKYIFATDPDDMSMLYYLGVEGYFAVPLLLLSLFFYIQNKKKEILDYLFIGSFVFFIILMIVEVLHYNSIFFGSLSEKFIGVQMRRGAWILMLFSAILNFSNIQKMIYNSDAKKLYLLVGLSVVYLFPNILALYILLFIALFYFRETKMLYLLGSSILFLSIGIMLNFYHFDSIRLLQSFAFISVITLFVSSSIYFKILDRKNILLIVVTTFIVSTSLIGLAKGKFVDDLKMMTNNGVLSYPNLLKLEKDVYAKQEKIINHKIIKHIRDNNTKKEFVLESFDNLFYGDAVIYDCPMLISRTNIAMPMFSRLYYEHLLYKVGIFKVDEKMLHESKENTLEVIEKNIGTLDEIDMKKLYDKFKVRFLISKNKFLFIEPVLYENGYYLYDLEKELEIDEKR